MSVLWLRMNMENEREWERKRKSEKESESSNIEWKGDHPMRSWLYLFVFEK